MPTSYEDRKTREEAWSEERKAAKRERERAKNAARVRPPRPGRVRSYRERPERLAPRPLFQKVHLLPTGEVPLEDCFESILWRQQQKEGKRRTVLVGHGIDQAVSWMARQIPLVERTFLGTRGECRYRTPEWSYLLRYVPGILLEVKRWPRREEGPCRKAIWWDIQGWGVKSGCTALAQVTADWVDEQCVAAGVRLQSWHGPSAVSSAWMKKHRMKEHLPAPREEVRHAAECAYFGGHIQVFRVGVTGPTVKADINSAYASALAEMPSFKGRWVRRSQPDPFPPNECFPWSIWRVRWNVGNGSLNPHYPVTPFPWRDDRGIISYPSMGEGWYWGPQVEAAVDLWPDRQIALLECWDFIPDEPGLRPWAWIREEYARRQSFAGSNPMGAIWKQAMSACYGKLIQSVGGASYSCITAAGLCTSIVRAKMLRALCSAPDRALMAMTDCVWIRGLEGTHAPPADTHLGGWREEDLDGFAAFSPALFAELPSRGRGIWNVHSAGCKEGSIGENVFREWEAKGLLGQAIGYRDILWTPALCAEMGCWDKLGEMETQAVVLPLQPGGGFDDVEQPGVWRSYTPMPSRPSSAPYRTLKAIREGG